MGTHPWTQGVRRVHKAIGLQGPHAAKGQATVGVPHGHTPMDPRGPKGPQGHWPTGPTRRQGPGDSGGAPWAHTHGPKGSEGSTRPLAYRTHTPPRARRQWGGVPHGHTPMDPWTPRVQGHPWASGAHVHAWPSRAPRPSQGLMGPWPLQGSGALRAPFLKKRAGADHPDGPPVGLALPVAAPMACHEGLRTSKEGHWDGRRGA